MSTNGAVRIPGEGWQFVGTAMGANPTPLAFTEVYTALQTGAIDGQDNPMGAVKSMKFYEVSSQIVKTGHLIANNLFAISLSKWTTLSPAQQKTVQEAADKHRQMLCVILRPRAIFGPHDQVLIPRLPASRRRGCWQSWRRGWKSRVACTGCCRRSCPSGSRIWRWTICPAFPGG